MAAATKTAHQSRRFLLIAAVLDGMSRMNAARIGGMNRQTLREWVHRFNKSGPLSLPGASRSRTGSRTRPRIGQKTGRVRQWARRGLRPHQPANQRHESACLFGAICPARGTGAAGPPFRQHRSHATPLGRDRSQAGARGACAPAARSRQPAHHKQLGRPEQPDAPPPRPRAPRS
jgi:Winged helix-turn helix